MTKFLKGAAVGGIAGAFAAVAAIAVAGTGVGGVFNLGQTNTVNAQTALSGSVAKNAQLRVENGSTASASLGVVGRLTSSTPGTDSAGVRGIMSGSANGYGIWGQHLGSGAAVYGTSTAGKGVYGRHLGPSGIEPGVQGESASALAAGVVGKNTAGGPGLTAIANPGKPPLSVSSQGKVANLNVDQLDGKDSSAFLPSTGDIDFWYSPYHYTSPQAALTLSPGDGPSLQVRSTTTGARYVLFPLDQPQSIFGRTLKLKSVTICFNSQGVPITGTALVYGQTPSAGSAVYSDSYTHSSPEETCYDVAPTTPTVISGSLYLKLNLYCAATTDSIYLYSVRATLGT